MARYIDADALYKKLYPLDLADKRKYTINAKAVADAIANIPTADVVPKSEYDALIGKLECFLCHATGGRLSKHTYDLRTMETVATDLINETYNDGYGEGYKDCAREIIADMRELIKGYENIDVYLDRIEKKYTEGEE